MTTSTQGRLAEPQVDPCPGCGAPLDEDQEWCLECGAARTTLRAPPDWRLAVAIVVGVVAVVVAALLIALP